MTRRLALIARDAEDLEVISSILQDAVVPINEMAFIEEENRFILIASRFCREDKAGEGETRDGVFERVNCALRFDRISAVRAAEPRSGAADRDDVPARHPVRGGVYRLVFFRRRHNPFDSGRGRLPDRRPGSAVADAFEAGPP